MKDKHYLAELLGKNVKKYRIEQGQTIEELSQKSSISEKYILRIESGKATGVKFTQAMRIASVLNIKIHQLFE